MRDRTHNDPSFKVAAIVDDAIAELLLLGTENRDQAVKLMACQAIVRVNEPKVIAEIADFAESFIERDAGGPEHA